jgi:hypothetical protein
MLLDARQYFAGKIFGGYEAAKELERHTIKAMYP